MNNRRDFLKAMALLPLASCSRSVVNKFPSGPPLSTASPSGWQPDGRQLNLEKVKIKRVRAITAWHGPRDTSPVGHAANAHIDLAIWNFGIQVGKQFNELTHEVFPGTPRIDNGYLFVNEAPGLGIDINEELARKYPLPVYNYNWPQVRKRDGTPVRP